MKYTRKEAKAFFDWFEKRDFDHHKKTKENYMMEAFIKGMQLVKESESIPDNGSFYCYNREKGFNHSLCQLLQCTNCMLLETKSS